MHSMGPPDWRCPWDQQGPANNLPDCWGSLSRCPARRNGDWRGGRRLRPSSSEESSWNRWCRPVGRKEKALFPALLSFQRCYSKKYWGLLGLQETTAPTGQAKRRLVRLHDVYILKVSLLRGWMFKAMRGSFVWNPVIHFHNTGKLMFAGQCLGIKSQAAKNVAVCPWGWFTSKTLQACSVLLRIQGCAMYQPTFSSLAVSIAFSHVKANDMWKITRFLTRIWTRELPLSCSGTPEGIRCLYRCFSFFFSSFFFPLRFCLFLFFFLGACCAEPLGSWMDAVVWHATLLCSKEGLKQKYGKDVNTGREMKQFSIASVN